MIFSSEINSIRTIPMSSDDISFKGKSLKEVQMDYFLNYLPSARYLYTRSIKQNSKTLVLFQFQAQIIAYGLLTDNMRFEQPDNNGYKGAYYFDPLSICVLIDPLQLEDVKTIWKDFKGFNQSMHDLDCSKLHQFLQLISQRKKISATDIFNTSELDKTFQQIINYEFWEPSGAFVDVPKLPILITVENQKQVWARSILRKINALKCANYLCEIDPKHKHFTSQASGKNYVEAHHILPMNYQSEFENSLDVEANIVSLCLVCHKKIHRARFEEKEGLLKKLYSERSNRLKSCGISIKLLELLSYYR